MSLTSKSLCTQGRVGLAEPTSFTCSEMKQAQLWVVPKRAVTAQLGLPLDKVRIAAVLFGFCHCDNRVLLQVVRATSSIRQRSKITGGEASVGNVCSARLWLSHSRCTCPAYCSYGLS